MKALAVVLMPKTLSHGLIIVIQLTGIGAMNRAISILAGSGCVLTLIWCSGCAVVAVTDAGVTVVATVIKNRVEANE